MGKNIYILANDFVIEWLVAVLNSLNRNCPQAYIRLIPFDTNLVATRRLCEKGKIEIFEHESFEELLAIGRKLELGKTISGPNWFKRFAAFFGPAECFSYMRLKQSRMPNVILFILGAT
jgi:hypothetical protein